MFINPFVEETRSVCFYMIFMYLALGARDKISLGIER